MAKAKHKRRRKRRSHVDTLVQIIRERHQEDGHKPPHRVLRELVRDRRAENLLLTELRRTIRKWAKQPSKLPRYEVARRWSKLLKM